MSNLSGKILGNYEFKEMIGDGGFATIYKAIHIPSGLPVAIKAISKFSSFSPSNEFKLTQKIRYPSIIETFDFFTVKRISFIVMQFFPQGSLNTYIKNHPKLSVDQIKHIFVQVVSAVDYLHSNSICHRDIKLSNVLMDSEMNVKLIDFGLACSFNSLHPSIIGGCGSPDYAAPEIWKEIPYSEKVDVWSLGVFLFRLLFVFLPFDEGDTKKTALRIINGKPKIPPTTPPVLIDLFDKVFEKDPNKRISAKMLLDHVWLSEVPKLTKNALVIDEKLISIIQQKGIPTNTIREDILNRKVNEATVFYRILSVTQQPNITIERKVLPPLSKLGSQKMIKLDISVKKDVDRLSQLKPTFNPSTPFKGVRPMPGSPHQKRSIAQKAPPSLT